MNWWKRLIGPFTTPDSERDGLSQVQHILGYHFRNESLLTLALTHRSFSNSRDVNRTSNERLEYLGDSVLGLVIADRLYHDHPDLREGELTKLKAMLVNETTLSNIGKEMELNQHIRLSAEEDKLGGRERPSIISDAFESVIGAVYIDGGLEAARDVILRSIYLRKEVIITDDSQKNFKGELLELIQARGEGMPRYDVVSESGPDHEKEFTVVVFVADRRIGTGVGSTKKEAEQRAAAMALDAFREMMH
jgi:ribonuclease-3